MEFKFAVKCLVYNFGSIFIDSLVIEEKDRAPWDHNEFRKALSVWQTVSICIVLWWHCLIVRGAFKPPVLFCIHSSTGLGYPKLSGKEDNIFCHLTQCLF